MVNNIEWPIRAFKSSLAKFYAGNFVYRIGSRWGLLIKLFLSKRQQIHERGRGREWSMIKNIKFPFSNQNKTNIVTAETFKSK